MINLRKINDMQMQPRGQGKEGGYIFLLIIIILSNNVLDLNSPVLHSYVYGACHWCSLDKPDLHGLFESLNNQQ